MREYFNFMIIVIVIKFVRRLNILHSQVPNCRGGGGVNCDFQIVFLPISINNDDTPPPNYEFFIKDTTIMCSFYQYSIINKTTKHLLTELKREKIIHCKTHHLIICYKISLIKTVA